jgi:hypothetical protein
MSKRYIIISILLILFSCVNAQENNGTFQFLKLPLSAHATALGGDNISLIDDDITLAMNNPALLSCISARTLNLNYMHYIDGVKVASAAYAIAAGERASWAVSAMYMDYGSMKRVTEENIDIGTFSAKDIVMSGIFSYDLSDYWSGGVKSNLIYSKYDSYSSFAIGVDLGLNYYHEENDFSFSVAACNLGGQIVAFEDRHEKLPFDLKVGISKRLAHAPLRVSATLYELTKWNSENKPLNHIIIGLDFIPTDYLYIALGYNFRRADEMKVAGASHWAGLTAGAGINIKRFKIGAAYSKQHVSASSFVFNLSTTL